MRASRVCVADCRGGTDPSARGGPCKPGSDKPGSCHSSGSRQGSSPGSSAPPDTRGGISEWMDLIISIGVVEPVEKPRLRRPARQNGCAALVDRYPQRARVAVDGISLSTGNPHGVGSRPQRDPAASTRRPPDVHRPVMRWRGCGQAGGGPVVCHRSPQGFPQVWTTDQKGRMTTFRDPHLRPSPHHGPVTHCPQVWTTLWRAQLWTAVETGERTSRPATSSM